MRLKLIALTTMGMAVLIMAGLSVAQDEPKKEEGSELHTIMEEVQRNNATILRGVRSAAMFVRLQEDVATAGADLVKLAKKAKPLGEATAKEKQKPIEDWNKLMDEWIKHQEEFATLVAKPEASQAQAKDAYRVVSQTCTKCHEEFRIEDADF